MIEYIISRVNNAIDILTKKKKVNRYKCYSRFCQYATPNKKIGNILQI